MNSDSLRNSMLAGLLAIGLAACAAPVSAGGYANPPLLTETGQLAGLIEARQVRVVDGRPGDADDACDIPWARPIPWKQSLAADDLPRPISLEQG